MKTNSIITFAILVGCGLGLATLHAVTPSESGTETKTPVQLSQAYGKLPLSFEANAGLTDPSVKFVSRGSGYSLFLTNNEAVLALTKKDASAQQKSASAILRMKLVGAKTSPVVSGQNELPGKANYFTGSDPKKWRTDLPTYAKVRYEQVYPGIDLVYYGNQRQLEYDFVVAPGADPARIRLGFEGAQKMHVDTRGDLLVETNGGSVRWQKPLVYQEIDGVRKMIDGKYLLRRGYQASFEVASYDVTKPLIIDPTLVYSTYLGGGGDFGNGIAIDSSGNAYVTGSTQSTFFPTTPGAFQTAKAGGIQDAFVTKLDPTGSALVYSTYLGGNSTDSGIGIAVDSLGNACVTGFTQSTNFPTTSGAFQTVKLGPQDAFVTKLDPTGSTLLYSTYLGGNNTDQGNGIAVDALSNAYVTGFTQSVNFPTTLLAFQTSRTGAINAFVTKLDPTGTTLVYSTYLGGGLDQGNGIAVDSLGNAYVTGRTQASTFPTTLGAFQTTSGGRIDAFVTELNSTGTGLVYSTFLGGSVDDFGNGIAVDGLGNAYVTGFTTSSNFPTTLGAFQTTKAGNLGIPDAFVTKLNAGGTTLLYSTYLGGNSTDQAKSIAVDALGDAFVTGVTASSDFPTTPGAFQSANGGGTDAFVTTLNPSGTSLVYSTYLGGNGEDQGNGITVDASGNAYVTGNAGSTNFPTTPGAFQTIGGTNAFVAKFGGFPFVPTFPFVIGDRNAVVGNHVTFWGAQWAQQNSLSGGRTPASFKGFANSTNPNPPACGGTWQSDPGNSSNPPDSVPSLINVIAASSITKSGLIISGNVFELVTIQVDPGYAPDPGHPGTGTVTAIVCQ